MLRVLLILQCISVALLGLESIYIFLEWKTKQQSHLFLYCVAALINNLGYLMEMTAETAREAMRGVQFCYFGKVWIPLSFFVMVMEMCEIKLPKKVYAILAAIHSSIFILVLTSSRHSLYYATKTYVSDGFFPHYVFGHSMIYNSYMLLVESYIVVGFFVLIRRLQQELSKKYKRTLWYFFAATVVMSLGFALCMINLVPGYDTTCIGYLIASIIMFVAIFKHKIMDTLSLVRDYVADTLSEGLVAVNRNGRVIYYNDSMKKIYPDIEEKNEEVLKEIRGKITDHEVLKKEDCIYEAKLEPLMHGGDFQGNLYVLSDVTERYQHMEELREQKEIAEAANASKSAFLSIVSHEIRTPMNAVVGMTDLLLQDDLTEKQRKYMQNIKNSGSALVMIINDILDQSKIEAGKMEIVEAPYEIRPLVEDVQMIIENRIGSKSIRLMVQIDEKIPGLLVGDALRIRQIFINLMNNAVKFTESGYIQLSAKVVEETEDGYRIRFGVKDSGQGIREEDLEKLGKAFSQVDVQKNHSKEGTGLGLSISKDFIALMGGELKVESEYGKGTEFFFTILQKKATEQKESGERVKCTWKVENFKAPGAKALIVDDTEMNLMVMRNMLKHLGMTAVTAGSGEAAMELVGEDTFQAIFMDYMMPGMDGVETTDRIRKLASEQSDEGRGAYYKSVPIIALTGDVSEKTQELFRIAGINDFIEKPVAFDKVKKSLLKWLPEEVIEYEK